MIFFLYLYAGPGGILSGNENHENPIHDETSISRNRIAVFSISRKGVLSQENRARIIYDAGYGLDLYRNPTKVTTKAKYGI